MCILCMISGAATRHGRENLDLLDRRDNLELLVDIVMYLTILFRLR